MNTLKTFACMLVTFFFMGCSDDNDTPTVAFHVSVGEVKDYSATITVTHNATNRDVYYSFVVKGAVTDLLGEIKRFLDNIGGNNMLSDYEHHQRKSVFKVTGLTPTTTFTYIVFGMDADGQLFGNPGSIIFSTEASNFTARENENWTVTYKGHTVYNDNDYSLISVALKGNAQERFFLATYSATLSDTFDSLTDFIAYAADEFSRRENDTGDADFWLEDSQVRIGSTNFYRRMDPGDYVSYAIGLNADGTPTGSYARCEPYHVDKYPATTAYQQLIDNLWSIEKDGRTYYVTFDEKIINRSLVMTGWGNYAKYPITVRFNRSTSGLTFPTQMVAVADTVTLGGSERHGNIALRGAYYDSDGKLQYLNKSHIIANATLTPDGTYMFETAFSVELSDGTSTTNTGMMFVVSGGDTGTTGFARMMFPFEMRIE